MAWEWSHSQEAYDIARKNLNKKSKAWLAECLAEWQCKSGEPVEFQTLAKLNMSLTKEQLALCVWENAEVQRTCENGGYSPWMCPHGCHTVEW